MISRPPLRLLMLSIGGMLGQNLLDCLRGRRHEVFLIGLGSDPGSPRCFQCDKAYLAPPTTAPAAFRNRLEAIIAAEQPDLVIPGRDEDVVALAELREARPDLAPRLACGSMAATQAIRDKWLTAQFARTHGLAFADSAIAEEGHVGPLLEALVSRHGFPILAKPRSGWGSGGVYLARHESHLARLAAEGDYLFQEFLDPVPDLEAFFSRLELGVPLGFALPQTGIYAAQTCIAPSGEVTPFCCTVNKLVLGRPEWSAPCAPPALDAMARDFAEAFAGEGWVGPFNVQCKERPDGSFCAFELNGRFTASTSTRLCFGHDELGTLVRAFLGPDRLTDLGRPMTQDRWILKTLREDVVLASDVKRLQEEGVWIR